MKRGLLLVFIMLFLPVAYGLSITIDNPASNAVLAGSVEVQATLGFNVDINGNASRVYFYYKNMSESEYTLYANSTGNFTKYSYSFNTSNFDDTLEGNITIIVSNASNENVSASIAIKINNVQPVSTMIPDMVWLEDIINDTLNLSMYFSDGEKRNTFSYSASSVNDIEVSVNSNTGMVTMKPNANFSGIRYVRFTASDGTLSNTSNEVMLNITNANDRPIFAEIIQNRTWVKNTKMVVKVNESFKDLDNDRLNYSYTLEKNNVEIEMNANGTAVITPKQDFIGLDSVVFSASDNEYNALSNKVVLEIIAKAGNKAPVLGMVEPSEDKIELKKGETRKFKINKSDPDNDNVSVKWYVNGKAEKENSDEYEFKTESLGSYEVKVEISDGAETVSKSWTVNIEGSANQANASDGNGSIGSKCGNNAVDAGEDCENCMADVKCKKGEKCVNKTCTRAENKTSIALIIGLIVLVGGAGAGIFYFRKNIFGRKEEKTIIVEPAKKIDFDKGENPVAEINDFYSVRKRDGDEIKHFDDLGKRVKGGGKVDEALLRSYVKMALEKNTPEEKIKKSLVSEGWSEEQIQKMLKELR